jgi:hypothetical protein
VHIAGFYSGASKNKNISHALAHTAKKILALRAF